MGEYSMRELVDVFGGVLNESPKSVRSWIDALKPILNEHLPDVLWEGRTAAVRIDSLRMHLEDFLFEVAGKKKSEEEEVEEDCADDIEPAEDTVKEWIEVARTISIILSTLKQCEEKKKVQSSEEPIPNYNSKVDESDNHRVWCETLTRVMTHANKDLAKRLKKIDSQEKKKKKKNECSHRKRTAQTSST